MRIGPHPPFISSFTQDLAMVGDLPYSRMNEFQHLWLWSLADVVSNAGSTIAWPKLISFLSESHISHLHNGGNSIYHTELFLRVG